MMTIFEKILIFVSAGERKGNVSSSSTPERSAATKKKFRTSDDYDVTIIIAIIITLQIGLWRGGSQSLTHSHTRQHFGRLDANNFFGHESARLFTK